MKKIFSLLILFAFLTNCDKKTNENNQAIDNSSDSLNIHKNEGTALNLKFVNHSKNGILLSGTYKNYDVNGNEIGTFSTKDIVPIKILQKSEKQYNLDKETAICLKANFLKIGIKDTEYIFFGTDVFEQNEKAKIDFLNDDKEKFMLLPIKNFKMGASDDEGLTGCEEFSHMLIFDVKNNKYATIGSSNTSENKLAKLLSDDSQYDEVYSVKHEKDSLTIGVKTQYQEGYSSYFLRTSSKDNFLNSKISNKKNFDDEETFNKLK